MAKNRINNDLPDEVINIADESKESSTAAKTPKRTAVKSDDTVQPTVVYCGPTIKGVVKQYSHFCNGIPEKLKAYSEQNKEVKRLIVPVQKFIETKRNINITGTIENISYIRIQKGE